MSTLVTIQDVEDEEQSLCDLSMDFSFDCSPNWGHFTSTPIKLDDTATHESDTSSPVSFPSLSFSFIEDAAGVDDVEETTTEVSGAQSSSSFPGQLQANDSCSIQPY